MLSSTVHPQGTMQAHTGLLATSGMPSRHLAGTHGAPRHVRCTPRVPCKQTWGTCSPMVHPQSAIQAHMGHVVIYGAPSGHHAGTYGAPSYYSHTRGRSWCPSTPHGTPCVRE